MGQDEPGKRRISLDLSEDMVAWLDRLKPEYGLRSRGAIVEQLLAILRDGPEDESNLEQEPTLSDRDNDQDLSSTSVTIAPADTRAGASDRSQGSRTLEDTTAIVLIHSALVSQLDPSCDAGATHASSSRDGVDRRSEAVAGGGGQGIQLPGFVRRQARELRRSLQSEPRAAEPDRGLSLVSTSDLKQALERVDQHWSEVYGQPPGEAVLEAAMVWLARDVWPQSDHSDGRPFSWSLAQQVVQSFAPSWVIEAASLARVITAAGVLEDPFSGGTLAVRIPTLITRFVQRHRSRQKRTTSFEAIDQTMTVHSALRLLQLPTVADRPYSFKEIRDAYREQAQNHHPDAGGSADAMRRLNEAYQFLKERYRRAA